MFPLKPTHLWIFPWIFLWHHNSTYDFRDFPSRQRLFHGCSVVPRFWSSALIRTSHVLRTGRYWAPDGWGNKNRSILRRGQAARLMCFPSVFSRFQVAVHFRQRLMHQNKYYTILCVYIYIYIYRVLHLYIYIYINEYMFILERRGEEQTLRHDQALSPMSLTSRPRLLVSKKSNNFQLS